MTSGAGSGGGAESQQAQQGVEAFSACEHGAPGAWAAQRGCAACKSALMKAMWHQ